MLLYICPFPCHRGTRGSSAPQPRHHDGAALYFCPQLPVDDSSRWCAVSYFSVPWSSKPSCHGYYFISLYPLKAASISPAPGAGNAHHRAFSRRPFSGTVAMVEMDPTTLSQPNAHHSHVKQSGKNSALFIYRLCTNVVWISKGKGHAAVIALGIDWFAYSKGKQRIYLMQ